jgi:hypothetical protein
MCVVCVYVWCVCACDVRACGVCARARAREVQITAVKTYEQKNTATFMSVYSVWNYE